MKASWQRRQRQILGFNLDIPKVPETAEEFDREASKPTSALEQAVDSTLYRDTLPQFKTNLTFRQIEQLALTWRMLDARKQEVADTPQLGPILDTAITLVRLEIILICQEYLTQPLD
jgi:hypothetical protein